MAVVWWRGVRREQESALQGLRFLCIAARGICWGNAATYIPNCRSRRLSLLAGVWGRGAPTKAVPLKNGGSKPPPYREWALVHCFTGKSVGEN